MASGMEHDAVFELEDDEGRTLISSKNSYKQLQENVVLRTKPIDIPIQPRNSSQRHTNFTPPRTYNNSGGPHSVLSLHSMAHSCSTPRGLTLNYHLDVVLDVDRNVETGAELRPIDWRRHSLLSEPNFRVDVVEREIGRDLRVISDIFHIQSAGFDQGYDFIGWDHVRHSSSYPGATRCRVDRGWQRIIQAVSPCSPSSSTNPPLNE